MKYLNKLSPSVIFLCTAAVYILGFFAHALYLHKTVYGDGTYYYAWLTLHPSKFSVGPALFWAPSYYLLRIPNEFVRELAAGLTDVAAALFGLVLIFRLLTRRHSRTVSIMAILAIAGASNLLFYGSVDTVNSHALSFFVVCVFLSLTFSKKIYWFAVGAALAMIGLMRPQDLVFGILVLPFILKNVLGKKLSFSKAKLWAQRIIEFILGFLLFFAPQLLAWQHTTSVFYLSPYLTHNEGFNFLHPQILGALFGVRSGLFLWTPITAIGVYGLVTGKKYWLLTVFLLELWIVASWSTWWQGASYSARMFVSTLPILSLGVADVFTAIAKYRFTQAHFLLTLVGPLTVINGISIVYFLLTLPK